MAILIGITPLIIFIVFSIIISIQDWITDRRKIDRIRVSFCKVDCLPIGELESDKVYNFSKPKVGIVTSLHSNEELDEAEKLIKEAKEKKV